MKILLFILLLSFVKIGLTQTPEGVRDSNGVIIVPERPESQIYEDLFPKGHRAPWGYRQYEKWQMQQIHHIDVIDVEHYLRTQWRRGLIPFTGDTTKLVWKGMVQNTDYIPSDSTFKTMYYPTYEYYDTIYTVPTLEGFELWKGLGRPKAK